MVTIRCITYNHEPYIRQCLEGFVIQKTNFRFEVVVHDDASTDGTASIIREYAEKYPNIIKPIFEIENQYLKGGFKQINKIMEEKFIYGKYLADCEGDDYWIDPLKLQKQVDIMEANSNAMLCHTGFHTVDVNSQLISLPAFDNYMLRSRSGDNLLNLFKGNYIMTMTTLFRTNVRLSKEFQDCPSKYDYTLFLTAAIKGDFIYLPDITACYRITATGAMATQKDSVISGNYEAYKYFSRLILSGKSKKLSFVKSCVLKFHILSHSYKSNDSTFVRECITNDVVSFILLPVVVLYNTFNSKEK